jgi:hypothetical protein
VLVTNGVYSAGGAVTPGFALSNRVVVTTNITVESVNGPDATIILGQSSNGTNGRWAVRCAYLETGARLVGFTLSNGHTRAQGDYVTELMGGGALARYGSSLHSCIISGNSANQNGGGVYISYNSTAAFSRICGNAAYYGGGVHLGNRAIVEQCVVSGNEASGYGGGVYSYGGKAAYCTISGNKADYAGGADFSSGSIENSTICSNESVRKAGGINARFNSRIQNCIILNNLAGANGGGIEASSSDIINCLVYRNRADSNGGGIFANNGSEVQNCTIVSNISAIGGGGLHCLNNVDSLNCIVYFNSGSVATPNYRNYGTGIYYECCCTTPAVTGIVDHTGNIDTDPAFVNFDGGDFHLLKSSPCVDTGDNESWMFGGTDLDGYARIYNSRVDMGAYEYSPLAPFGGISVRCYEPKLRNKKKKGILKCRTILPVLKKYLTNNYGIGMWNMETDSNVDGPRPLTAKNKKETVWIYSDKTDKTAKIVYGERYNKKKHKYKIKLKYVLEGQIPVSNLVYVAPMP